MPKNSGKTAVSSCKSHATTPPNTSSPTTSDLTSKLATTTRPIKNAVDAKAYLEQRSLIAVKNNYDLGTLANLLIMSSINPKIPNQTTNVMKAVALLMVNKFQTTFAEEIAVVITDKLHAPTTQILNHLDHKKDFLSALCTDQAKHIQQLHDLITSSNNIIKHLTSTTDTLEKATVTVSSIPMTLLIPTQQNTLPHYHQSNRGAKILTLTLTHALTLPH